MLLFHCFWLSIFFPFLPHNQSFVVWSMSGLVAFSTNVKKNISYSYEQIFHHMSPKNDHITENAFEQNNLICYNKMTAYEKWLIFHASKSESKSECESENLFTDENENEHCFSQLAYYRVYIFNTMHTQTLTRTHAKSNVCMTRKRNNNINKIKRNEFCYRGYICSWLGCVDTTIIFLAQ